MKQLNTYMIDTVRLVESGPWDENHSCGVQMVTYTLIAESAEEALRLFTEKEVGRIVFEGEIVDSVIVGIEKGQS